MTERQPWGDPVRSSVVRQHMGCGYEPTDPSIPVIAWDGQSLGRVPQSDEYDENGKYLHPVCAGYVCGLPEVIEATHAHFFLTRGGLLQWTDGAPPTAAIKQAVVELESEQGRVVEWCSKNPQKA